MCGLQEHCNGDRPKKARGRGSLRVAWSSSSRQTRESVSQNRKIKNIDRRWEVSGVAKLGSSGAVGCRWQEEQGCSIECNGNLCPSRSPSRYEVSLIHAGKMTTRDGAGG